MSISAIRWVSLGVFVLIGIPGMIVSSVNDRTGAAVTFGLVTVGAVLALLAATAVVTGRIPPEAGAPVTRAGTERAETERDGAELEAGSRIWSAPAPTRPPSATSSARPSASAVRGTPAILP